MRISVFGIGYVGVVSCGCLAELGHEVIGVDISAEKIAMLAAGRSPIVEDEIDTLIADAVRLGQLTTTDDVADAVNRTDVSFISVGTPSARGRQRGARRGGRGRGGDRPRHPRQAGAAHGGDALHRAAGHRRGPRDPAAGTRVRAHAWATASLLQQPGISARRLLGARLPRAAVHPDRSAAGRRRGHPARDLRADPCRGACRALSRGRKRQTHLQRLSRREAGLRQRGRRDPRVLRRRRARGVPVAVRGQGAECFGAPI